MFEFSADFIPYISVNTDRDLILVILRNCQNMVSTTPRPYIPYVRISIFRLALCGRFRSIFNQILAKLGGRLISDTLEFNTEDV